jgi:hypothetical protein
MKKLYSITLRTYAQSVHQQLYFNSLLDLLKSDLIDLSPIYILF